MIDKKNYYHQRYYNKILMLNNTAYMNRSNTFLTNYKLVWNHFSNFAHTIFHYTPLIALNKFLEHTYISFIRKISNASVRIPI